MTPDDGLDPIDGSPVNPVRQRAMEALEAKDWRERTSLEDIRRATDDYWWASICLETLGCLPGAIDPPLSALTELRAYQIVSQAYDVEIRAERALGSSNWNGAHL